MIKQKYINIYKWKTPELFIEEISFLNLYEGDISLMSGGWECNEIKIEYCPFCGNKLEVIENETDV
jgi:hypothetical protein